MGKKQKTKKDIPTASQADPMENEDEDLFGDDEAETVSEVPEVKPRGVSVLIAPPIESPIGDLPGSVSVLTPPVENVPLNQVPGKLRKFLNQKGSK